LAGGANIRVRSIVILLWTVAVVALVVWVGRRARTRVPATIPQQGFAVRVLLFDNIRSCTLAARDGLELRGRDGTSYAVRDGSAAAVVLALSEGRIVAGEYALGREVAVSSDPSGVVEIDGQKYRGSLNFLVGADGGSFDVVNVVPAEAYLAGVIGAEMPSYWEIEALKAQAVASRTYALYHKQKYGPQRSWDLRRTEGNQVYRGLAAETATVREAVRQTHGIVLLCRSNSGETLFPAYFGSTCGGHTESSRNVFGDDWSPLIGVACPYCTATAPAAYLEWPAVEMDVAEVWKRLVEQYPTLQRLESIEAIEPAVVGEYGDLRRITRVRLVGNNGKSQRLEAENLRLTLDPTGRKLKSTACVIERSGNLFRFHSGRGFGHAVGMCQYGAEGLARASKTCEDILALYYPGARTCKLY